MTVLGIVQLLLEFQAPFWGACVGVGISHTMVKHYESRDLK